MKCPKYYEDVENCFTWNKNGGTCEGCPQYVEGGDKMKYHYGVIHAVVECEDCEWRTESYKNAQAIAKIHAKKHGHKVSGELAISFGYNGRIEKKVKKNETVC